MFPLGLPGPPGCPCLGSGAPASAFGAAWQGDSLPAPLERNPAPRSSAPLGLPHPPTPSFWGTGKCPIIVATREDTKALGHSSLVTSSGTLSSCSSPRPHLQSWSGPVPCHHVPPWCSSLPSAARALSPGIPSCCAPRQTHHLPPAITSASGPGCSGTSLWQCLHEMATLCPGWFAPSTHLSPPSAGVCQERAAALEWLSFASFWQGEAGLARGHNTLDPLGTLR